MKNFESNTKPSVSCILPFYNAEKYLHSTLSSIANIDYSNIQLILINDGSTDQSLDIVKIFLNNSSLKENHRIINNNENLGISYSKNIGLNNCTGEYFFFAGADDIQNCQRISKPLDYLQKNPSTDIVYFDCTICSSAQSFKEQRKFPLGMNQENSILYQLKRNHFWSGLFLARNTVNEKFDEKISSAVDYDWYFNLFFNHKEINFIRESFLNYKIHENNISRNLSSSLFNVRKILKKYNFDMLKNQLIKQFDSNDVNLSFAWFEITLGRYKKAIDLLNSIHQEFNFLESTFLLGSCYAQLNDFDVAQDYFAELVRKFPNSADCLNNLAVSKFLFSNRNREECILLCKKALEINPRYSDAHHNSLCFKRENYESLKFTTTPLRETLIHS